MTRHACRPGTMMRIADAAIVHDPGAEAATPFRALCQWSATISGFDTIARRRAGDALADAVASMISGTKDASARSVVRSLACFGEGAAFRRGERHGFVPPRAALIHERPRKHWVSKVISRPPSTLRRAPRTTCFSMSAPACARWRKIFAIANRSVRADLSKGNVFEKQHK